MMEFYASFFMVSTLVLWFLWLRERSKRKYAELDRTSAVLYWRNEEARVAEKFLELEAEYNELLGSYLLQSEGEWVIKKESTFPQYEPSEYACSVCDSRRSAMYNFCPNCGARMKGGADES